MAKATYQLLIDQIPCEQRAALLKDDQLVELMVEREGLVEGAVLSEGAVYNARVVNVVPALQAAFVDFGTGENGFLPVSGTNQQDISKAVHEGQSLLVQLKKLPREGKGAYLTALIDLPAEHMVLTLGRPGLNISRKILDDVMRQKIRDRLQEILPADLGLVVRTSAQQCSLDELETELRKLLSQYHRLHAEKITKTGLVLGGPDFAEKLAGKFQELPDLEVIVEGGNLAAFKTHFAHVDSYSDSPPLFEREGVEDQITEALNITVPLQGGGDLVIERTSALIAVDVNMGGRAEGRDGDDNILRLNKAALNEISRQLVLRNLSGQILVDFVFLKTKKQRADFRSFVETFFFDGRTTFHGFTRLGLMELSRQRIGPALDEVLAGPSASFYALVRKLAKGSMVKSIAMGQGVFDCWQNPAHQGLLLWLKGRLGYLPEPCLSLTSSSDSYHLE